MCEAYKVCLLIALTAFALIENSETGVPRVPHLGSCTHNLIMMTRTLQGIASLYSPASPYPIETALLSFVLAAGTYATAKFLTQVHTSLIYEGSFCRDSNHVYASN